MSSPLDAFQLLEELSEGIVPEEFLEGEFDDYFDDCYPAESDSESDLTSPEQEKFEDDEESIEDDEVTEDKVDVDQITATGSLAIPYLIYFLFTYMSTQ